MTEQQRRRNFSSYCSVRSCENSGGNCQKSFFRFPEDFTRARKWAILCNRHDLLKFANLRNRRVCEEHFEREMFVFSRSTGRRKLLTRNAYPSLFLEVSSQTAENTVYDSDDQMEPTENTKTQIMFNTADYDEAENYSTESMFEEIVDYERNTRKDVDQNFKTEIQLDPLEIIDEELNDTSISSQEAEVRRGEKGHGVKRKREEDDDIEILLGIKRNVVKDDIEVGLPLKDCCGHHQDRIKELEHQLELCHEVIDTFIKQTKAELEVRKTDIPKDQSSEKRWKNEIDLLKMRNNQLMCQVKFMKIKEASFQSRLDHLLYLLNTEKDNHDQLEEEEEKKWGFIEAVDTDDDEEILSSLKENDEYDVDDKIFANIRNLLQEGHATPENLANQPSTSESMLQAPDSAFENRLEEEEEKKWGFIEVVAEEFVDTDNDEEILNSLKEHDEYDVDDKFFATTQNLLQEEHALQTPENLANQPRTSKSMLQAEKPPLTSEDTILDPMEETFFEKNQCFQWDTKPVAALSKVKKNIIRTGQTQKRLAQARETRTPIDCFNLFFSENILEKILQHTNQRMEVIREGYKNKNNPALKNATMEEMQALIGLLVLNAAMKHNNLNQNLLFKREYCGDHYIVTFSKERFKILLIALRFDDKATPEVRNNDNGRLVPISDIWEEFLVNSRTMYEPGSYLTVDERLDQLCHSMDCKRKSHRWPLTLFYNMINLASVNAYIIYVHNILTEQEEPLSRVNFMLQLHKQLTQDWLMIRHQMPGIQRPLKELISRHVSGRQEVESRSTASDEPEPTKRTTCHFCDHKRRRMTTTYCLRRECWKPVCLGHSKKVCIDCLPIFELRELIGRASGRQEVESRSTANDEPEPTKRTTCHYCDHKKRRMTTAYCSRRKCWKPVCLEHSKKVCIDCFPKFEQCALKIGQI